MSNLMSNGSKNFSNRINTSSLTTCREFDIINRIYLRETIAGLGFFLNLICLFIFLKILRSTKSNIDLYKYFLIGTCFNTYVCLRNTLKNSLECKKCFLENYYSLKIIHMIFIYYIDYSVELATIMISVAACFNRYRSIDNTPKIFNKIPFIIVVCLIGVFCACFCSYKLVDLSIQSELSNNSTDFVVYVIKSNSLGTVGSTLDLVYTMIRDVIPIFSILLLNILTLVKIKTRIYKKKKLISKKLTRTNINRKANHELRLNLMVFSTSSFVLLNHMTNFLYWLKVFGTSECFLNMARNILYWSSYGIGFFIYLSFDLNFIKFFMSKCSKK